MPHDPELVAETRSWLVKGKMDLDAAAFELTAVPPFTGDVVFHAQQSAEKAFKAFLTWHSSPFRKTHNLEEYLARYVKPRILTHCQIKPEPLAVTVKQGDKTINCME